MPVVSVRVTEDGFHVPGETARALGFRPGQEAQVEIRRAPDRDAIRQLALRYAWRRLGDAIGVEQPEWSGDGWVVRLKVRGHAGDLGALLLTADGTVLEDRSTSKEELLDQLDAAGATPPAA